MSTDAEMIEEIRRTIESYRWMNGGLGIAVSPNLAKALAKHGVTEGYFAAVEIPDQDGEQWVAEKSSNVCAKAEQSFRMGQTA